MTSTPPDRIHPVVKRESSGPVRVGWRIAHSLWLLFPILSFGCLSAAGFLYVGLRARRPSWWIPGIVYSVLANVCFWINGQAISDPVSTVLVALLVFLIWPASVVHAAIINVSWLKWRAGFQPWYVQPHQTAWVAPPTVATPTPLPPQMQHVVPPPQQFYSPPPPSPAPIDVNSATELQFTTLPGITPERAAQIVAVRRSRGGFIGVNDFAGAAGLAPHEFVAVRDHLVCGPPAPPDDPSPAPFGRIVDV